MTVVGSPPPPPSRCSTPRRHRCPVSPPRQSPVPGTQHTHRTQAPAQQTAVQAHRRQVIQCHSTPRGAPSKRESRLLRRPSLPRSIPLRGAHWNTLDRCECCALQLCPSVLCARCIGAVTLPLPSPSYQQPPLCYQQPTGAPPRPCMCACMPGGHEWTWVGGRLAMMTATMVMRTWMGSRHCYSKRTRGGGHASSWTPPRLDETWCKANHHLEHPTPLSSEHARTLPHFLLPVAAAPHTRACARTYAHAATAMQTHPNSVALARLQKATGGGGHSPQRASGLVAGLRAGSMGHGWARAGGLISAASPIIITINIIIIPVVVSPASEALQAAHELRPRARPQLLVLGPAGRSRPVARHGPAQGLLAALHAQKHTGTQGMHVLRGRGRRRQVGLEVGQG